MDLKLNIKELFNNEQELLDIVDLRKICYDYEPYYIANKKSELVQIGYQLNLYGTFDASQKNVTPDDIEFSMVLRDVRSLAEALSKTCSPLHMCESTIIDSGTLAYSQERGMRPDVTVHIPIFDQKNFGHTINENIRNTLATAIKLIESAGVQKTRWHD